MTAVDHAELKRLAEAAISSLNSGLTVKQIEAAAVAFDVAANSSVVLGLLSEIEGLKAERAETEKRASEYFVAMREAQTNAAVYKHDKLEAERQLSALRTQAPDSGRPDREEAARIIACHLTDAPDTVCIPITITAGDLRAIYAALRPQTAESGK